MLQTMRNNAQGMIAKIIMGFLILVFALWGVESIVSLGGGESAAIKVDGQKVSEAEVANAMAQQKANLQRQFGENFDEEMFNDKFLRQSAVEQIVEEKIAVVRAQKLGLKASKRMIDDQIVAIPAFQEEGRFSKEQFQTVLSLNGLTPLGFRAKLAEESAVNQAQAGFALSSFATPFDAKLLGALEQEQRTFRFTEVKGRDWEAKAEVTDAEITQAYEASKDQLRIPEQVSVRYIELSLADMLAKQSVSAEELDAAYQKALAVEGKAEQRQAHHILLEVNDKRNLEQTKTLALELKARLEKGEDFAALAKEYSDDIGTKANGGDLGINVRGSFDDAFENALYALQEGQISDPVQTEFGVHLIRADKILKAQTRSLAEMKPELEAQIRKEKASEEYNNKVKDLSEQAFAAKTLDELAKEAQLHIQETPLFSHAEGAGLASNPEFRATAFSDVVLFSKELSSVLELKDVAVVMALKEHQPETVKSLDSVRAMLVGKLKREKGLELAKVQAEAVASGQAQANDWKTITTNYSMASEAPRAAQQRAFAMVQDQTQVIPNQGSYLVVNLTKVQAKSWQDTAVEAPLADGSRYTRGRGDVLSYQAWSRSVTEVTK